MPPETSFLRLGWKIDDHFDPEYWLTDNAKAGDQQDSSLVLVPSDSIDAHTLIMAQSGSGKSSFLGRLIEEMVVRTRSNLIILDPNSDFRRIYQIDPSIYANPVYDRVKQEGKLPDKAAEPEFLAYWSGLGIKILTRSYPLIDNDRDIILSGVWLPDLPIELIASDDQILGMELFHCHEFVRLVKDLIYLHYSFNVMPPDIDLLFQAKQLLVLSRKMDRYEYTNYLDKQYIDSSFNYALCLANLGFFSFKHFIVKAGPNVAVLKNMYFEALRKEAEFISDTTEKYYFGRMRFLEAERIIDAKCRRNNPAQDLEEELKSKILVIDMFSYEQKIGALIAMKVLLNKKWEIAKLEWDKAIRKSKDEDERVPTFIVIDEAHQIIPAEARNNVEKTMKEFFRRIAAEGRKLGVFLILVTQRPDKLDPKVVSECENFAVMRIGGGVMQVQIAKIAGVDLPELEPCTNFPISRVLLSGKWRKHLASNRFMSIARRTMEGGRSLRPKWWATNPNYPH